MWPNNRGRRKTDKDTLDQSIAYDNILNDSKVSNLIMLYDEVDLLLFEKPPVKPKTKKI